MITRNQIKSATTKELQKIYAELFGKPTTNRNASALRARLLGALDTGSYPSAQTRTENTAPAKSKSKAQKAKVKVKPSPQAKRSIKPQPKAPVKASSGRGGAHADSETRKLFAQLKPGQVLSHRFRSGGDDFTLTCEVVTPPGLDGKGGQYRYDGKIYDTAREVIDAMGAPKWNPALFFKLRPYWPHKKRESKGVK